MRELNLFYELNDKLIHATKDFIGYDPLISVPLNAPAVAIGEGKIMAGQSFILGDEKFYAVFDTYVGAGPLRGYRILEIYKEGKLLVILKTGILHAGNETNCYIEGDKVYMIVTGTDLRFKGELETYNNLEPSKNFLLIFNTITIPKEFENGIDEIKTSSNFISAEEQLSFEQISWEGEINTDMGKVNVKDVYVPAIVSGKTNPSVFQKMMQLTDYNKKIFTTCNNSFEFQHPSKKV